jgi:multimeric flavodoxin WrbA
MFHNKKTQESAMKVLILNGSPKADNSITLQHILFLARELALEIEVIPIAKAITVFEKDEDAFNQVIEKIKAANAVVWSFPVYYALVPAQMKRFIELLFERCPNEPFAGRYSTAVTTSINFFDHTAHNYLQGVCEDLGFNYVKGYSAHMDDFFHDEQRKKLIAHFQWFIEIKANQLPTPRKYRMNLSSSPEYKPGPLALKTKPDASPEILVLSDETDPNTNLAHMIKTFTQTSSLPVKVKYLQDIGMKHGCLGCCTCGYDNSCIQKDGFTQFYNEQLKTAEIILIAGTIRDHYLSAVWKQFFDRSFFNGHAPVLQGKRIGFIISGPLSQLQNLRETLDALTDNWHMKHCGVVTDEAGTPDQVTQEIIGFAKGLELACATGLEFGTNFYGVGGGKIFRDFIYNSSAVFKADHQFYKRHDVYQSLPQRKIKKRLFNAIFSIIMKPAFIRREIHKKFIPAMVAPYKKILNKTSSST